MNINNRITRYNDLINDDSLSAFDNHAAQQNHNVYQKFYDLLYQTKPQKILEIGTSLGGFTQFLKIVSDELNLNTYILSFDIYTKPWYDEIIKQGIDIKVENIFINNFSDINNFVKDFIQSNGNVIILCDGGCKISEFNILSKFLKTNDIIMAHDYAPDKDYFEKYIRNKIWNWHEIQLSDIEESCKKYSLEPFMYEEFLNVAWACFKKAP